MWCALQDVEAAGGAASEEELSDSEEEFHSQVCTRAVVNSRDTPACAPDLLALHRCHAMFASPKTSHNVETRFYCPQTFLSLDLQCRGDVSELE